MNDAAIQNLEFLRQLIEEARQSEAFKDAEKLRMLQGSGMGFDSVDRSEA